jgi:hypothetical protein
MTRFRHIDVVVPTDDGTILPTGDLNLPVLLISPLVGRTITLLLLLLASVHQN